MNLREEILENSYNRKTRLETTGNDVMTVVTKAFAHDYALDGDNALEKYVEVFGESTRPYFDFLSDNEVQLNEFVIGYEGSLMEADDESVSEYYNSLLVEKERPMEGADWDKRDRVSSNLPSKSLAPLNASSRSAGFDAKHMRDEMKDNTPSGSAAQLRDKLDASPLGKQPKELHSFKDDILKNTGTETGAKFKALGGDQDDSSFASAHSQTGTTQTNSSMNLDGEKENIHTPAPSSGAAKAVAAKSMLTKGFLRRLWDKIKMFGGGIKHYFSAHPTLLKTLGIAGGVAGGALLISRLMKKAKENKQRPATA